MKKQKEILVYDLPEVVACYMYETKQEEVSFNEINNLYKSLLNYSDNKYEIYVNYAPDTEMEKLPTFIPLFEVKKDKIKLLNEIEILDVYVVLVKGLEPNKKNMLLKLVKDCLNVVALKNENSTSF